MTDHKDDAAKWKAAVDDTLGGMAGQWMQGLEKELPPESGVIVIMYNKQGDPAHVVTVTLNDGLGDALKILHEAEALIVKRASVDGERTYTAPTSSLPPGYLPMISSTRVQRVGAHDVVRVWNRGALAGELVMSPGDGDVLSAMLGLVNRSRARIYERQLEAMIAAAQLWRKTHSSMQLVIDWPNEMLIASLRPLIGSLAKNVASRDFLEALDAAADGEATVVMAQAAYEATA